MIVPIQKLQFHKMDETEVVYQPAILRLILQSRRKNKTAYVQVIFPKAVQRTITTKADRPNNIAPH